MTRLMSETPKCSPDHDGDGERYADMLKRMRPCIAHGITI